MMRRPFAVLLTFAVILIGPAVRSAAAATPSSTPSTIYAYDAAHDTSNLTSDPRLDRDAAEALHAAPADSARAASAASSDFVAAKTELPAISEANVGHTFRNATGHLADDTAANRTLLRGAAQPGNKVGSYNGIDTYTQLQSDGSQVWVEVRNDEITNGDVNQTPYTWDPTAGKLRR